MLLSTNDAAELLGLAPKTLRNWRVRGFGPPFLRLGSRVKYRESDLQRFLEDNQFSSTSEARAAK